MTYKFEGLVSGVYEIRNVLNNHRYIGSSINVYKRFNEHLRSLNNNRHCNGYLQKAWNKYGNKHFAFIVLEKCEPIKDTLLMLEQKYLDLLPEYNICIKAGNTIGVVFSEERKRKIGLANSKRVIKDETRLKHSINSSNSYWNSVLRRPVEMWCLQTGVLIKEFRSITEAALYMGSINKRTNIKRAANKVQTKAYGYFWTYKNK